MLILVVNLIIAIGLVALYRWLSVKLGWFGKDHIQVPKWVAFLLSFAGIFIPVTPLWADGMFIAALIYIGNEWVYQNTGWSPIMHTVEALKRFMNADTEGEGGKENA